MNKYKYVFSRFKIYYKIYKINNKASYKQNETLKQISTI